MEIDERTWEFVTRYAGEDPARLRLRFAGKQMEGVDIPLALTQIEARRKAAHKLPWLRSASQLGVRSEESGMPTDRFLFPNTLSAEQCTAQAVADYHAEVAGQPGRLLDLTCGLGIDAMTMARKGWQTDVCEISEPHCRAAGWNARLFGLKDFRVHHTDCAAFLESLPEGERFDLIFVDPARRSSTNARTYALADCAPDILGLLPQIARHTDRLLIKASPMLDVSQVLRELPCATHVHAVSLKGECKELLIDASQLGVRSEKSEVGFTAVDIGPEGRNAFSFKASECSGKAPVCVPSAEAATPWSLLFEPGVALMKFASMAPLQSRFPDLLRLDANTHLYVGSEDHELPGRWLRVRAVLPYNKQASRDLPQRVNVVTRNFPDTPEQVRKRLKIKDGGSDFLYCARIAGRPLLLLCEPLKC